MTMNLVFTWFVVAAITWLAIWWKHQPFGFKKWLVVIFWPAAFIFLCADKWPNLSAGKKASWAILAFLGGAFIVVLLFHLITSMFSGGKEEAEGRKPRRPAVQDQAQPRPVQQQPVAPAAPAATPAPAAGGAGGPAAPTQGAAQPAAEQGAGQGTTSREVEQCQGEAHQLKVDLAEARRQLANCNTPPDPPPRKAGAKKGANGKGASKHSKKEEKVVAAPTAPAKAACNGCGTTPPKFAPAKAEVRPTAEADRITARPPPGMPAWMADQAGHKR